MARRKTGTVVISDVHLGTYGCQAKPLVHYLRSIEPKRLVLNGDIIDIWQFSKRYWPKQHMQVLKEIVKFAARDIPVYYITGNHDELLRKFSDFSLGNFHLVDQLELSLNGKKTWIFHGDIFDPSIQHVRWLAKLGGWGYDLLILLNSLINKILVRMGRERWSFSKRIKDNVKLAVKYVGDFEATAAEIARENGYDTVVCGHIHKPQQRSIPVEEGQIEYLNCGDWVEHCSALEHHNGRWHLVFFDPDTRDIRPLLAPASREPQPMTSPLQPQLHSVSA